MYRDYTRKMNGYQLTISANWASASSQILFKVDNEGFVKAPFIVALTKHKPDIAFDLIDRWLEKQNPSY